MPIALEDQLEDLKNHLDILPEAKAPPPSILEVLGRSHQEQDWQRLLFHFLSPDESHGLGHELLETFLTALSERDDLEYSFSRFDLEDVRIAQEVSTSRGRPDAVLWSNEEWFLCWELKVWSTEGRGQTQAYVEIESFDGIGLSKDDVPEDSHFYLYLAPDGADPPEADEFVQISWEWIVSVLQSFLAESHGEYPARTTAQLNDFIGTIRSELTMTEYQENLQEKASLYVDYYDEIAAVQDAFESE